MKVWHISEPTARPVLDEPIPLPALAATLLGNRGIVDPVDVAEFLHPDYHRDLHDPFLFHDMARVVDRIFTAAEHGHRVVVYGDYDADGVCSAVLLVTTLQALHVNVAEVYLPHRETEGYGLNLPAVERFIADQTSLLITLDCGTTNRDEVLRASQAGIDVIVIDHHHVPNDLPGAFALLNPKMPNAGYPFRHLASVGMAFKTAQGLFQRRLAAHPEEQERWSQFEKWLLDLVAIATVTDLVPLQGENRTLLKYGLVVLNKTKRLGLKHLVATMGGELGNLDTYSIGYQIGPRLNAAGRMNHANAAYKLLMAEDAVSAEELARQLEQENKNRQQVTEQITNAARAALHGHENDRVLVADGDDWPVGLVGLVASRLTEQFHRPVLVIGRTALGVTGSGRSIPAFNIIESLHTMPELFIKFGGHAQACGFTLKSAEDIPVLRQSLNDLATQQLKDLDVVGTLTIDASLLLKDVQDDLFNLVRMFEPYGMMNPKPKFLFTNVRVVGCSRVGGDGQHLKLSLGDGQGTIRPAIGFGLGERGSDLRMGDTVDVVAEVSMNEWNGRREIQLKVLDFRSSLPA